jgi:hypothetical protein
MALAVAMLLMNLTVAVPTFAGPVEDGATAILNKDYATAMRLLRPLAERGDAGAQWLVGGMYDEGQGVQQNSGQAAVWYRKAAEQSDGAAQLDLGVKYLLGDGVPKNYSEAMKWTLMAAKQGKASAQIQMGTIYKHGYGVPQNYILAYMWFDVATHDAYHKELSKNDIAQLTPDMAPSQISEAESLAQQCLQSNYQACPPTRDNMASSASRNPSQTRLPLKTIGGTFVVPVDINGVVTLNFFIDSGASDVTVPADVFSTLKRTGTIRDSDVVGQRTYLLADGSKT